MCTRFYQLINCLTSKRLCKQQANGNKGLLHTASKINANHTSLPPACETHLHYIYGRIKRFKYNGCL